MSWGRGVHDRGDPAPARHLNGLLEWRLAELARAGAKVGVFDLSAENAGRVAKEIDGLALVGDITKEADLARLFAEAETRLGPTDILVYWDTVYKSFMFAFPARQAGGSH